MTSATPSGRLLPMAFAAALLAGLEGTGAAPVSLVVDDASDVLHPGGCAATGAAPCSLADAITFANRNTGADTISFALPGGGARMIPVTSPLPRITERVTIDGTTQSGFSGAPLVALLGFGLPDGASLLEVDAAGVVVRGLSLGGAPGPAIRVTGDGAVVEGCRIGLDPGWVRSPNGSGILVAADGVRIGGLGANEANVIAWSLGAGVEVTAGRRTTIRGNFFTGNSGLAIDLGPEGPTPNDTRDVDEGANGLQNSPRLESIQVTTAAGAGTETRVTGLLSSRPSATFTVDVYRGPSCDPATGGPAQTWYGSRTVTTDAAGDAAFSVIAAGTVPDGTFFSATATDAEGSTSELSACLATRAGADLGIGPLQLLRALAGGSLEYQLEVTNAGPATAHGVTLSQGALPGATFVSCTTSGVACAPTNGGALAFQADIGDLSAGSRATVRASFRAPVAGGSFTPSVSVAAATADPSLVDNQRTFHVTVPTDAADVSIEATVAPTVAFPQARLTYGVTVRNAGPLAADGVVVRSSGLEGLNQASCVPSQGRCDVAAPSLSFVVTLGRIEPGASATVELGVDVDRPGPSVDAVFVATVDEGPDDPVPGNNAVTLVTPVLPDASSADVEVDIEGKPYSGVSAVEILGQPICVTVRNHGPGPALGVRLATGSSVIALPPGGALPGTFELGTIPAGGHASVELLAVPAITATVSTTSTDPDPRNDRETFTVRYLDCNDLSQACPFFLLDSLAADICRARLATPLETSCGTIRASAEPETPAARATDPPLDLPLLWRVRDEVLARTPAGRRYTELFRSQALAITAVFFREPSLALRARETVLLWEPNLRALADGKGSTAIVTASQVAALDGILEELRTKGSTELGSVIERERSAFDLFALVGLTMDQALFAQSLTVPPAATLSTAASIGGVGTSTFVSDVRLLNPSTDLPATAVLRYRCFAGPCAPRTATLTLSPGEMRVLDDAVRSLFDAPGTAGAVEVAGDVLVDSRVRSPGASGGTTGSHVPGLGADRAFASSVLTSLSRSASLSTGFRTNAGAFNPSDDPVDATFTLFDAAGVRLGAASRRIGPRATVQVNDVFAAAGVSGDVPGAYAIVEADGVHELFAYATVIDNRTLDSIFVRGRNARDDSGEVVTIPAVASIHGAGGSYFHSDVSVFNPSATRTVTVTADYRCFSGACAPSTRSFTVAPREMKIFPDVVAGLLGAPESAGTVVFTGGVHVDSRVYTPERGAPTVGAYVPGLAASEATVRAVLPSLARSADPSRGFRSNAGVFNPSPAPLGITFTLHAPSGAVLGSPVARTVPGGAGVQVNDLLGQAGAGENVDAAYAVVAGDGVTPFFTWATVNDNVSQDAVFIEGRSFSPSALVAGTAPVRAAEGDGGSSLLGRAWNRLVGRAKEVVR